jgi:hypothetical protein
MRRLPKDEPSTPIRLDFPNTIRADLDYAAVIEARLSVASWARLALELLVQKGSVSKSEIVAEADRRLGRAGRTAPAPPRRGRPRAAAK